ncbi:MAG: hypothetical protein KatS3mg110_0738 [Pirellulaceae bacterium]|nr:MAG: hypothetical protein KatS3mg110_0738 [Pirellulaceae bacterium]
MKKLPDGVGEIVERRRFLRQVAVGACAAHLGDPVVESRRADSRSAKNDSLYGKLLCGYQGWFRCAGDGSGDGWWHWSRRPERLAPDTVAVEMWPDMESYSPEEQYEAAGFVYPDGRPATLFSSYHPQTVLRHFRWMQQYGIHGAVVQRFLVELRRRSTDVVLEHVRQAARQTGRLWAIGYDMTGMEADRILACLQDDWRKLVDQWKIIEDPLYLQHRGRPVLMVWGFFPDRFPAVVAHQVLDWLQLDRRYGVCVIGGIPWYWRRVADHLWLTAYQRMDVLSPWNVGNYRIRNDVKVANTDTWEGDLQTAARFGHDLMPVLYPGFGWSNLKRRRSDREEIPRRKGAFFQEQLDVVARLNISCAYVAMFDELDEGTAILPVSNQPPQQARFVTYEDLPSDAYLRLAGEAAQRLAGAARE